MKENSTSVPANRVCPFATVRVNFLSESSQTLVNFEAPVPERALAVPAPVKAEMVTIESAVVCARCTFGLSVTVIVLAAPASGVLCPIIMVVNAGTTILRGFAPPVTPRRSVPSPTNAAVVKPEHTMLGVTAF